MSDKKTALLSQDFLVSAAAPAASLPPSIEVYEPSIACSVHSAFSNRRAWEEGVLSRRVHVISLLVNILLFGSKLWVYVQSQSMVVLAALIDSTVDLLAQGILLLTNRLATLARDPSQIVILPPTTLKLLQ